MTEKRKETIRAIKFLLFSVSAGVIQIGADILFNEAFNLPPEYSYLISLVLSVAWNFTLNRKFTFQSANNVPIAMLKVAGFNVVFTPLSFWWTKLLAPAWGTYLVQAITMIINFVSEYLFQRFFVFGKSLDTASKKK